MDRAETVAREIFFRWASDGRMTMTADDIARLVPLYAAAIRAERERCAQFISDWHAQHGMGLLMTSDEAGALAQALARDDLSFVDE